MVVRLEPDVWKMGRWVRLDIPEKIHALLYEYL
jgi:hypothetical protein